MKNPKTPKYQRKASKDYVARQRAAGKIRFSRWVSPDLLKRLIELIDNYKG